MTPKHLFSLIALALLSLVSASAAEQFVSFVNSPSTMLLCQQNDKFGICVSDNDNIAVKKAAANLCSDFKKVANATVNILRQAQEPQDGLDCRIIIGTIGQSNAIDQLVKEKKIDGKELKGKIEKYIITTIDGKLVIAGSDRRGTVYGIYELSRQMGVSPWYYWMDVPVKTQKEVRVKTGTYTDGEPAVRYRGIFLNDEAPCLTTWVKNAFGTKRGGHEFYEKVFELILRLKGNYMWPAMWGWAFYADDPLNSKTADEMGVMIGTSHHEPMARSQQEWHGHTDDPNAEVQDEASRQHKKEWNYATNKETLDKFWLGGVERVSKTEDIITIGMRGDGDMAMSEERNTILLESVVENQRKLIEKAYGRPAKTVPQVWALYKEVQDYYDDGMRVPDDVIMLLCDDNWGNVRRVPNLKERKHKGGWGLYYHVDYVGAPRNTKTLNVTPVENMVEQLSLAYENGIQKLWILNVGDLKPMEYPIQLFMDMAWEGPEGPGSRFKVQGSRLLDQNLKYFCSTFVGEEKAAEAADLLERVSKLNGRCTPEMLDANTYNLEEGEWQTVVDEYKDLEIETLRMYASLPSGESAGNSGNAGNSGRDAFFEAILFPIQFMGNLHQMYYAQAMNNYLHEKGDAAMNEWADKCEKYFKRDAELMRQYNKDIAGGKWDGMMIQKHIGYTSWNDNFKEDMLPRLYRTDNVQNIFCEDGRGYISIEAEHFVEKKSPSPSFSHLPKGEGEVTAEWTVIPNMGRTLGAVTLLPTTAEVNGASLTYKFFASSDEQVRSQVSGGSKFQVSGGSKVTVHIITKSTLDFLNKGGMTYSVAIDGGEAKTINFNSDMNEAKENIYDKYYPTIARRVIEKTCELQLGNVSDGIHTLTFTPNDPGIVLEKIIIDFGGYKKQYLFGKESKRK